MQVLVHRVKELPSNWNSHDRALLSPEADKLRSDKFPTVGKKKKPEKKDKALSTGGTSREAEAQQRKKRRRREAARKNIYEDTNVSKNK